MKALLCKTWGEPETLVVESIARPEPGPGQVLLRVHAAGVNFPDALIVQNKYQFKPPLPFSPGSESAGVVAAIGAGVSRVKPGDRVLSFALWGAFAEYTLVDESAVVAMPESLDYDVGAAFVLTYATSYHGLVDRGGLKAGETLLVLGASGGVGLAAVEIGKRLGARVIAAASSAEKLAVCREHGADDTIDYSSADLKARIKDITGGRGVDVIYDPVGGAYTEAALRSSAWRGRLLIVGFANGEIPRLPANLTLLKGCSVIGVFLGDYMKREPERYQADLAQLFAWLADGSLRPHIAARYPLERAAEALRALLDRRVSGKLVLTIAP